MGRAAETLTMVFPMWNEEQSILLAVDAAREAGEHLVENDDIDAYDIVIVDDASTDATGRMADELHEQEPGRIHVVHHEQNKGLGGSVKTGLAHATGDLVLYTDADLPCDLMDSLQKAVRLARIYDADIVSAYRHDRTAEGPRRAVYSLVYNSMIRFGFGLRVRDVNFAFKLVRRRTLDAVGPNLESEGSFIDAELLIRAHRLGFHVIQFGVDYFPRTRGVSTLSSGSTIATIVKEMAALRPTLNAITPGDPAPRRHRRRPTTAATNDEPKLLIVNADDYGLTEAVSRGILKAHADGIVTSTSILTLAPGFNTSAKWLVGEDSLGVGVHLAAVGEDGPLLQAKEIPSLVDAKGRLPRNWRAFIAKAVTGRIDPDDLRKEFKAQIEAVEQLGITPDHLDTHQHLHLWPLVRQVVLDLAEDKGIKAVRVPRATTTFPGKGVNRLADQLAKAADARNIAHPGDAAGVDEAGAMDATRIARALARLAATNAKAVELSCHPGEHDDPDRARYEWGYSWGEELAALTAPATKHHVERHGFVLATYADLARSPRPL
ncbi:MAG: hypothetical protein QOF60_1004 [Actinomycetota bacterium]|jgi:predicted glycoside hydrolase/deacetylase ChbG (UPF0249 family)|nr:hypothetical protein [Actinomycetota bacterium]